MELPRDPWTRAADLMQRDVRPDPGQNSVTAGINNGLIAVVTGANRGIGLEVCRQLAQRGVHVVLTARKPEAGGTATERLAAQNLPVEFQPLDVRDSASILQLKQYLDCKFGRLDILINNAAIVCMDQDGDVLNISLDTVRETMETNCYGPLQICQTMIPLLQKSSRPRLINVSSMAGSISQMEADWAAYRMSKSYLNALSAAFASKLKETRIIVAAMCPGWVRTEMGGPEAPRTVEQGADTIIWLALDAPPSVHGKFVQDREFVPW
jgi:NAD(P)-dependent dehydrogenase (short-subunit alcohol dehydrogenase family)